MAPNGHRNLRVLLGSSYLKFSIWMEKRHGGFNVVPVARFVCLMNQSLYRFAIYHHSSVPGVDPYAVPTELSLAAALRTECTDLGVVSQDAIRSRRS